MFSKVYLVVIVLTGVMCLTRALKESQICTGTNEKLDTAMDDEEDIFEKPLINVLKTHFLQDSENESVNITQLNKLSLDELLQLKFFNQARNLFVDDKSDGMNLFLPRNYLMQSVFELQVTLCFLICFAESSRGRGKMDQMLLSLLVAYKMKFLALIPTLIGSIVLLLASNALVGFFFALFATAVSIKRR